MSELKEVNFKACLDVLNEFLKAVKKKCKSDLSEEEIEDARKALEHLRTLLKTLNILHDNLEEAYEAVKTISVAGCAGKTPAVKECLGLYEKE
ncbi:MAG: hypothetical protein GTO45_12020 [Candidatus Aminicenantes bacterium]|nr:hypothetical protein [Candidatus Aminicenantes bacterium]NIM79521.1 hypothetical protein [Candidatus Aminicenantes bacterium]NIN18835.1 hypothetical protein [Candidatus Aminicenantes bacterium]NIN42748.1 hypothetical protein [Candidatus Aminicenantes bacterium]NIN85475.1 hypothetical protein [Candidatus Aminicenantes bacterium]